MKPDELAKSYDALAAQWDSDDYPRDYGIAQHRRALAFAARRGTALDIGCGSSGRIIDLLLSAGFDVEGLDISAKMIERARRRHPECTFHHADICSWRFPHCYDFISAWDSIWHVPLDRQEAVLRKIMAGLTPEGVLVFTCGGVDEPSETRDSAMGPPMYHATLGISRLLEIMSDSACACRHLEYDQHPELHVFIVAQRLGA